MSERKVINKYYPKDYDPSKLKREKKGKGVKKQTKVRLALPMSVQCLNCGNFMGRESKFNARKETVEGEEYLGQSVFRFYFRCSRCFQELTIKTDPKNAEYIAEHGIKANYILHKAAAEQESLETAEKENLELFDKMKALEQKSLSSLADSEINEAIDTVLLLQSRRAQLSTDELHERALHSLDSIVEHEQPLDDDELEELLEMEEAQAARYKAKTQNLTSSLFSFSAPSSSPNAASASQTSSSPSSSATLPSNVIDDDDEDPIALRSRLARQRIETLRQQEWNDASSLQQPTATPTSNQIHPSNQNGLHNILPIPSSSTTAPTAPSAPSSQATLFKAPIRKPIVSPITSSSPTSSSDAPLLVVATSSPANTQGLLGKKYARRDDDE